MTEEKKSILEIQTAQAVLYDNEAEVFDDISAHEDPAGKLRSFLLESFDFDDKTVLEAGAGAGSMRQNIIQNAFYTGPGRRSVLLCVLTGM